MTRFMKFTTVVALASLSAVSAQSFSVSQQCQSTLLGVAGSPDAACLNVQGLIPLLTTPANQSLIQPVTTWLGGACAANPCTNDQLSALVTNITNGCGQDLDSIGLTNDSVPMVISILQQAYPTARKILCLKDNTNNTFCATTLLTELQNAVGVPLSIDNIFGQLPAALAGQVNGLPKEAVCSDCVKEAYNILKQDQPALVNDDSVTEGLTQTCGASFIDGSDPSQIVEGTGSAAPTGGSNANGAAAFSHSAVVGVAVSSFAALAAAFAVLA